MSDGLRMIQAPLRRGEDSGKRVWVLESWEHARAIVFLITIQRRVNLSTIRDSFPPEQGIRIPLWYQSDINSQLINPSHIQDRSCSTTGGTVAFSNLLKRRNDQGSERKSYPKNLHCLVAVFTKERPKLENSISLFNKSTSVCGFQERLARLLSI